jgi:hypothetical protein
LAYKNKESLEKFKEKINNKNVLNLRLRS